MYPILESAIRYQLTRISLSSRDHFFHGPGCSRLIKTSLPSPMRVVHKSSAIFLSLFRCSNRRLVRESSEAASNRLYSARTSLAGWLATYLNNISVMVMGHGNNGNNRVVTVTKMGHCALLVVERHGILFIVRHAALLVPDCNMCFDPLVHALHAWCTGPLFIGAGR